MAEGMSLSAKKIVEGARHLLVELLIVFIGVYLAFELNEYSHQRETDQRRQQFLAALTQEIGDFSRGANQVIPRLDKLITEWRRAYESEKKPIPLLLEIGGADRPPRGMWQAVQASDAIILLPVESMKTVSEYYNALDVLLNKYTKLIEFSEREIVPFGTKDTFYQGNGRMLKPKYKAYMRRMQDWLNLFREVQKMAEESKASLQRVADSTAKH